MFLIHNRIDQARNSRRNYCQFIHERFFRFRHSFCFVLNKLFVVYTHDPVRIFLTSLSSSKHITSSKILVNVTLCCKGYSPRSAFPEDAFDLSEIEKWVLQNVLTDKGESMDVPFAIMRQDNRLLLVTTWLVSTIDVYSLTT